MFYLLEVFARASFLIFERPASEHSALETLTGQFTFREIAF